jgi:hypothetical protein
MRKPTAAGYYIDPARPAFPMFCKVKWAAERGLEPITYEEACGLSAALRQKPAQEAPGAPPAPPQAQTPAGSGIAASGLRSAPQAASGGTPPVKPVLQSWDTAPVVIQPTLMGWPVPQAQAPMQAVDIERRAAAKARVTEAVNRKGQATVSDQMRYELALKARNENVHAMALLEPEAGILKIGVAELAQRIIEDRQVRERRMTHVYAILARTSAEIDEATGADIDATADVAVREIATLED